MDNEGAFFAIGVRPGLGNGGSSRVHIAVVGPCGSGKSVLKERLMAEGHQVSAVAQEHSYVPDMWQRLVQPEVLVFLDVSLLSLQERLGVTWKQEWLDEQHRRLSHARDHCSLYVHTDGLTREKVAEKVLDFLAGLESG